MFLDVPQPTPADLQFSLAGISVRVSAWFWVAAALLGWSMCLGFSHGDQRELFRALVIWVTAMFVSILLHEMGHALAYRRFGQSAHVVLYHLGGMAIPDVWGGRGARRPHERLIVSAAGPLVQLLFAAAIVAVLKAGGYAVPFPIASVGMALGLDEGRPIESRLALVAIFFLLYVNVFWPLVNLVPVPPLDGGQIVREGLLTLGVADAARIAAIVGGVSGAVVAWWAYTHGEPYFAIMFAMLAVSCFQSLSDHTPWQRWN